MTYFKINGTDYSMYVNKLKVTISHIAKNRTNSSGDTVVGYINHKYVIDVGIIPLDADKMAALQKDIREYTATVSFLDPDTQELVEADCIIAKQSVEYYTIQNSNVKFKAFSLAFTEL